MPKMKTLKFYHIAKELEKIHFPHLKSNPYIVGHDETNMWDYAAPSFHFKPPNALMTERVVNDLRLNNKRLLDACCGPAYLEQLLVHGFGVPSEQIHLADISSKDIPKGFNYSQIDIFNELSALAGAYDYIIFPLFPHPLLDESNNLEKSINSQYSLLKNALSLLKPNGQVRVSPGFKNGFGIREKFESEFPNMRLCIYPGLTHVTKK